jgi:protein-tyrosine phosphatase
MEKKKILFVCLGNICRSPAAEGVMSSLIKKEGLEDSILVDSAGTLGYHIGEEADARMKEHAEKRGYELTSISRKFNPQKDFDEFDYIVTMDNSNYKDIYRLDTDHKHKDKIFKMAKFINRHNVNEVPDPYYEGPEGFEFVLDIIENGCEELLTKVKNEIRQPNKIKN